MPRTRLVGLALVMLSITLGSILAARPTEAGGGLCQEPTTDARGTAVDLKQNCMIATVLRIDEGVTVTFTNRDPVAHTVTGTGSPAGTATSFGSFKEIAPGQTFTHQFVTNGTYVYYCLFHSSMVGAIVVGDGSGPGAAIAGASVPKGDTTTGAAGAAAGSTNAGSDTFGARQIAIAALVTATVLLAAVSLRYTFIARTRNMKPSGDGSAERAQSPRG